MLSLLVLSKLLVSDSLYGCIQLEETKYMSRLSYLMQLNALCIYGTH